MADGQLPAKVWCMKADYAEATGTHNTGNANYVGTLYDVKTPPQEVDSRVRTTIFGFPSVIFHKKDESSEPEFIGKYNYNYDKGAENVFGFSSDYPLAECWEFKNNTSDPCLFHGEVTDDNWSANFEARYPDEYGNISAFKVMHSWVVSTWQDGATGGALASTYTDVDGKTYTKDTAEYRLAKFKTEFEDHFDKRFMTIYYLYTLVMLMVDQRAKNMFLTTWDGVKWEPWLYDNDTCLGINNEGELVFDYYHEDIDLLEGANVYNGQDSALWVNFRECYADEIQALYKSWRSDGKLTYQSIYDAFITNQSNKWSISVYNEDADYKYISMLRSDGNASNLNQIRGSGAEHLGYFVDNRLNYLDSKFDASAYHDNYATLRIYTPKTWAGVTPNANVTITPYSDMYAGIRYKANGEEQKVRAKANVPVTFTAPDEEFNDTETAVFGASEISSLGDLSPLYCGTIEVDKATKLTELICGSGVEGYSNTNMKKLVVGTNRLLRKVDVRNCPSLTAPLALANCPNMEEIYAEGTSITGLELPDSGYLKVVHLPDTITNLTMINQPHITDFTCAGYANVTSLRVENAPAIPVEDILKSATNLARVRLFDLNLELEDTTVLDTLAKCSGINETNDPIEKPVVYGVAHLASITQSQLAYYNEKLPNLTLTYDKYIAQYTVTFQNWDGTVLDVQYVVSGEDAVEPINAGRISTPTKEGDAQYSYTFNGWSGLYTIVTSNRSIIATYTQTVNQYTVRFYNGSVLLQTTTVDYGSSVTFSGEPPTYSGAEEGAYVFTGWSKDTSNVVSNMDVYATYSDLSDPNIEPIPFRDLEWDAIKTIAYAGSVNDNNDFEFNGKVWFSVGDEKVISLSTGEEVCLQIYGFNKQIKTDGDIAPITIGTKDLLEESYTMGVAPEVGYASSDMRTTLNETVFPLLPNSLQKVISMAAITTQYKPSGEWVDETSANTLFLLSTSECFGDDDSYPIFTDNASRVKHIGYGGSINFSWRLRSYYAVYSENWRIVDSNGAFSRDGANYFGYVCFAFCI